MRIITVLATMLHEQIDVLEDALTDRDWTLDYYYKVEQCIYAIDTFLVPVIDEWDEIKEFLKEEPKFEGSNCEHECDRCLDAYYDYTYLLFKALRFEADRLEMEYGPLRSL
jgi:hypothetical protein